MVGQAGSSLFVVLGDSYGRGNRTSRLANAAPEMDTIQNRFE